MIVSRLHLELLAGFLTHEDHISLRVGNQNLKLCLSTPFYHNY